MKKIILLLAFLTFSISVSAHQPTTALNNQLASKAVVVQNSQMYSSMYNGGSGGILKLIYNVFYKVGSMISATLSDEETPEEETTAGN